MLRILQVGLGPLGRRVVRDLYERGLGEVVAAVDVDPALAGRALSELVPESGSALPVVAALPERVVCDCAIVTTSSWLDVCAPTFRALLERGLAAVSTCEELVFPWLRGAALADELDALARARGGRLLGTGVNPGFLMDALPVMATAVSREVRAVEVARVQDAAQRRLPFQEKVGLGLSRAEFDARAATGRFGHAGLSESLHFIAQATGLELEAHESTIEPVIAEAPVGSGLGTIAPGMVRGLRQTARGATRCGRRVELEFVAVAGCEDPHDRVRIHGEPELDLKLSGGVHGDVATSAITLNAVRSLLDAPPGLHTMATVPPARWRRGA